MEGFSATEWINISFDSMQEPVVTYTQSLSHHMALKDCGMDPKIVHSNSDSRMGPFCLSFPLEATELFKTLTIGNKVALE